MKTLRFGIEIETVGLSKEGAARAIASVLGGTARPSGSGWDAVATDGRVWRAVPDGSLGGYHNAEIVSPILSYADIETLQEIVRALHTAGARADATCGIHIHIDGSRFDAKELTSLAKIVHKQERLIEAALGIQAHRLQRYCRPLDSAFIERLEARPPRTVAEVNAAWYGRQVHAPARYDQSRYHGVNLNSYFYRKTIEFRYFEGTTHAGKVKAYVQFCLALAAKALGAKSASSRRREYNAATAKYDFRVFLLSLGLIGEEFKTARLHLLSGLGGSAAWKGERRDRRAPRNPEERPAALTA
ncbi:MAG TPA: amidoligase family protein [Polyangiaceae bacterium]|jgi:hypothetical protein